MNIFALPGINQKTEKWAANLLQELAAADRHLTVQHYGHWDNGGDQCLNFHGEVERLQGCDIDLLIAKSLGVMIGLMACSRDLIRPSQMVLIGTPVTAFREQNIDLRQLVSGMSGTRLFIQQSHDIVGSCASLRDEVGEIESVEIIEIPGENHQYKDLKLLARHIRKLL